MPKRSDSLDLLLIADQPACTALLRRVLEARGIDFTIRQMAPGRAAIRYARIGSRARDGDMPDLILFDYSRPRPGCMALLRTLALGRKRAAAPIVVMTGPDTERLLEEAGEACPDTMMFSALKLTAFADRLALHGRDRFVRAATVMAELGPILVRVPGYFLREPERLAAANA